MSAPQYLVPPKWDKATITAFQMLAEGKCPEHLQKRALDWLINMACRTYDLSFDPASERGTAFAEGRRFVGLQIVKMLNLDPTKLKDET